jgi:hypothetical protein
MALADEVLINYQAYVCLRPFRFSLCFTQVIIREHEGSGIG